MGQRRHDDQYPKHARGLADAARRVFATHALPTPLSTIAQAARDALTGIEEAAIPLPGRDGQVRGIPPPTRRRWRCSRNWRKSPDGTDRRRR